MVNYLGLPQTFFSKGPDPLGMYLLLVLVRLRGAALLGHAWLGTCYELAIGHVMSLRRKEDISETGLSTDFHLFH